MSNYRNTSIYLSKPLARVAETEELRAKAAKERPNLSRRLAVIVERYQAIINRRNSYRVMDAPLERLLKRIFKERTPDVADILQLDQVVLDSGAGPKATREELAGEIRTMDVDGRVALLEALDL